VKRKERKYVFLKKDTSSVTCLFVGIWGIIGNKSRCVLLEGLAIEVGGLGDATAFTVLPVALSHVNMDDNDIYKNHSAIWVCTNTHHYAS
jgi:hypothetical protein